MLQIKDIKKQYITGELVQTALAGVSLNLRENEFVAILGPSGSGKTTLLNVIGGLDRYDSGDLIINGISTKKYSDRDWDSYRNHTIGFVFQSYNLIPHQTVLANVELALTISGISPSERKRRATKALQDVGLGNQLHKKPNQMSGGQMQRVAIARALVNDPDILLADEPTGALDSETSVQVMELLKEVSKDRLVVMVTHNPELAYEYANRIVRVKDGHIVDDTNPFVIEATDSAPVHKNMGKASMSIFTALSLSFNNLRTKLARTLLTSFAGSIGIIGIALIMSLSTGFQKYIDKIQEDTLSNYPLTIQSESADMGAALAAYGSSFASSEDLPDGVVAEQQMISAMFSQIAKNDLKSLKTHLDEHYDEMAYAINSIRYGYGIQPRIYLDDADTVFQVNPGSLFKNAARGSSMGARMDSNVFYEMIDNIQMLETQYDVVQGRWPEKYNEMVFVLTDPHRLTDYLAYTIGLKPASDLEDMIDKLMHGEEPGDVGVPAQWTYDDLMQLSFKLVNTSDYYRYNSEYNVWEKMTDDTQFMKILVANAEPLSIVGVICPKEGVNSTLLSTGIAYTSSLTRHVIENAEKSPIVQSQLADDLVNVFTGKEFDAEEEESQIDFQNLISVDGDAISSAFGMNIDVSSIMTMLQSYMNNAMSSMNVDTTEEQNAFLDLLASLCNEMLSEYVLTNADETGAAKLYLKDTESIVADFLETEDVKGQIKDFSDAYSIPEATCVQISDSLLKGLLTTIVVADVSANTITVESEPPIDSVAAAAFELDESDDTSPDIDDEVLANEESEDDEPEDDTSDELNPDELEDEPGDPENPDEQDPTPAEPDISEDVTVVDIIGNMYGTVTESAIEGLVDAYLDNPIVKGTSAAIATQMAQDKIREELNKQLAGFTGTLMGYIGNAFSVDEEKLASAFQFNMSEEDLMRLMNTMSGSSTASSAESNLKSLGYADLSVPTSISVYLVDFAAKEDFIAFLEAYNDQMKESEQEEKVVRYTDVTGIMMSSVRTIIDSVSYALIAFVAVSLVVSSIMIGIITYISVMERTKEIGVLRAIGASKKNISQVFNAETFIIGLCSGLIGIGITLILLVPGNQIIYHFTENPDIVAQLPVVNALVLICLSVVLTLIGGFIPARQAAKKDPVIALRSE